MLRRTVEALALQRDDLQRAEAALRPDSGRRPELHVLGVADGWRREDGAPIMSDSMFADVAELFGPTFDADALLDLLEGPADGAAAELPPTACSCSLRARARPARSSWRPLTLTVRGRRA